MLGLKLNHFSKRGPSGLVIHVVNDDKNRNKSAINIVPFDGPAESLPFFVDDIFCDSIIF